jgi:hypothetical protein
VIIPCDGLSHNYYVMDSGCSLTSSPHTFSVGAVEALSDLASEKRLHYFGHSIVAAGAANGVSDIVLTAFRKGYFPGNFGVSGDTLALVEGRIATLLALLTVTSSDVAVLDIGRNNGDTALTVGEQTSLTNILNALVGKGYGKVLVLGQLQLTGIAWTPDTNGLNGSISSLVSARADICVFVNRSTYDAGISTSGNDKTHPDVAGYAVMDANNVTYIDPLI